jgi:hypothetical protein
VAGSAPAATHLRESQLRVDALLDLLDRGQVADGAIQVVVLHDHGRLEVALQLLLLLHVADDVVVHLLDGGRHR